MTAITVMPNQSMQDVVLMACGTLEGAGAFCRANGVSISDVPAVGTVYTVPDDAPKDTASLRYLAENDIVIGTLNLGVCGLVANVVVGEPGFDSAEVSFEAGAGAVGMEWAVTTVDVAPVTGTLIAASATVVTAEGLTSATEYWFWIRTKCLGNYSAWVSAAFTTAIDPVSWRVVLKPMVEVIPDATLGDPHVEGMYKFDVVARGDFENINDLDETYLSDNKLYYQTEERWIGLHPTESDVPVTVTPMPDVFNTYELPWTVGLGYMMVWSDLTASTKTVTYKDVAGNQAYCAPLTILDNALQEIIDELIADITIDLISASETEVVLRLTRTHAAASLVNFSNISMAWIGAPLTGVADPADPSNNNKRIVTLAVGAHTIGVRSTYTSPISTVYPRSAFTMVIEVY